MRTRPIAAALAMVALAAAPALAQPAPPPPGPPGGPGPGPVGFALRALDLSVEQRAQIDALLDVRRQVEAADHPAVEAAHRALMDQIRATDFDEAAIRARVAAVAVHDAERAVADAALLRDIRAVLDDEQRETFERLLAPPPPPRGSGATERRGPPPR